MKVGKPSQETTREDYNLAFRRAVYNKAMDGLELTNEEIKQADKALIEAKLYQSYYNLQGSLDGLKANHQKSGNEMPITVGKQNIEYARRAGQAVLQYQEYKAKQADAKQEGNQSKTNQMLLDPLRLGGNVPFRWTERVLNTPRDIVQRIDKGEIMPGSSTAKWIGGKIGEQITRQPAALIPTISESVEQLTGTKLPSIPEIEVPRPFEYQTEKYKREAKIGEEIGATALDLFLLKRAIELKNPNVLKQEPIGAVNPALRRIYENKVKGLTLEVQEMKAAGKDAETIARTLHGKRRQLGIDYKDLTPPDMLKTVFERNMRDYGDKWGPSIEYLRTVKGKTWEQIIESACRPGGKDLGF